MKKIKKSDIINFGVDYIEVKGTSINLESIYFKGTRDKDYYQKDLGFPGFLIKKTEKVMNYQYKIILQKDGYDCLAYHKGEKNGDITTCDFLSVYGVAFKVFEDISMIFDFIKTHLDNNKIKRFDLAIDIACNVDDIYKKIKQSKKKQKGSIFFDENGKAQTFYIGEKKKSFNRYKLLRCYNKIDDIKRTGRQKLYTEYLKKGLVTRIELEFRSELTKDIELNDLNDRSYIFAVFLSYINKYTELFSDFKYEKIRLRRLIKKIDINELRYDEILKRRYINTYLGYSKTILAIGSCPVSILLQKNIISKHTIDNILDSVSLDDFDLLKYQEIIHKKNTQTYKFNNLFLNQDETDDD